MQTKGTAVGSLLNSDITVKQIEQCIICSVYITHAARMAQTKKITAMYSSLWRAASRPTWIRHPKDVGALSENSRFGMQFFVDA